MVRTVYATGKSGPGPWSSASFNALATDNSYRSGNWNPIDNRGTPGPRASRGKYIPARTNVIKELATDIGPQVGKAILKAGAPLLVAQLNKWKKSFWGESNSPGDIVWNDAQPSVLEELRGQCAIVPPTLPSNLNKRKRSVSFESSAGSSRKWYRLADSQSQSTPSTPTQSYSQVSQGIRNRVVNAYRKEYGKH